MPKRVIEWRLNPVAHDVFTGKPCKPASTVPSDLRWTVLHRIEPRSGLSNRLLYAHGAKCANSKKTDRHFQFRWKH